MAMGSLLRAEPSSSAAQLQQEREQPAVQSAPLRRVLESWVQALVRPVPPWWVAVAPRAPAKRTERARSARAEEKHPSALARIPRWRER